MTELCKMFSNSWKTITWLISKIFFISDSPITDGALHLRVSSSSLDIPRVRLLAIGLASYTLAGEAEYERSAFIIKKNVYIILGTFTFSLKRKAPNLMKTNFYCQDV